MAAAKEESTEAPAKAHEPGAEKPSKLTLILTLTNTLVSLGMTGILFLSFQKEKKSARIDDLLVKSSKTGHGDPKDAGMAKGHGAHGGAPGEASKDSAQKFVAFGKIINLEQFTVNLSTPGSISPKFARVNISLEVPGEDSESEVNAKMAQVRNTVIDLFNSKRPADLANAEGRDYLKDEIRNAINAFLMNGKIRGVYFTNFALTS